MKITKQRLKEIIREEFSEKYRRGAELTELDKAMTAIENVYRNEATREIAQQVVDELYRRFGRHEPPPEELMP